MLKTYLHPRCVMTRPFIACHNFKIDQVFKVIFTFGPFAGDTNCHLWVWKIDIMCVDPCIDELPNKHQPDQFDLSRSQQQQISVKINGFSPE